MFNWAEDTNCAITVCDTEGVVIFMNKQSILVNGDMRGKNMLPCHNERSRGIIDRKVMALGGVDADNIGSLRGYGFGGAVVLGAIWNRFNMYSTPDFRGLIAHFRKLRRAAG